MAQTMECPRCNGEGRIKRFALRDNGKCFDCRGTGSMIIPKKKMVLPSN